MAISAGAAVDELVLATSGTDFVVDYCRVVALYACVWLARLTFVAWEYAGGARGVTALTSLGFGWIEVSVISFLVTLIALVFVGEHKDQFLCRDTHLACDVVGARLAALNAALAGSFSGSYAASNFEEILSRACFARFLSVQDSLTLAFLAYAYFIAIPTRSRAIGTLAFLGIRREFLVPLVLWTSLADKGGHTLENSVLFAFGALSGRDTC